MAWLSLVKSSDGDLYLQGLGDPSQNADFSLYTLDGKVGDPFAGASEWHLVAEVPSLEYDPDDSDSFWSAQSEIIETARSKGFEIPDYVE